LVKNYRRVASRIKAESLNIPRTVVLKILKEYVGKSARFVAHSLTPEQREDQVTSCQGIIAMADSDKNYLNKFITGDILPMTPKQSDGFLNGMVRYSLGRRK
jgi:hypothetical protein